MGIEFKSLQYLNAPSTNALTLHDNGLRHYSLARYTHAHQNYIASSLAICVYEYESSELREVPIEEGHTY